MELKGSIEGCLIGTLVVVYGCCWTELTGHYEVAFVDISIQYQGKDKNQWTKMKQDENDQSVSCDQNIVTSHNLINFNKCIINLPMALIRPQCNPSSPSFGSIRPISSRFPLNVTNYWFLSSIMPSCVDWVTLLVFCSTLYWDIKQFVLFWPSFIMKLRRGR